MRAVLLLSALVPTQAGDPQANQVCVYNDGAYVMHWHLTDETTGANTDESNSYPVWQTRCKSADQITGNNVTEGHILVPHVHAVAGKDCSIDKKVAYSAAATGSISYTCKGTIFSCSCQQGPAPPTVQNVSKAVGKFLLGFVAALGDDIGFKSCISDINATFHDIQNISNHWGGGFKNKSPADIGGGFIALAQMLIDFGKAIKDCVTEGEDIAAKFTALGTKISADPWSIIEVIIKELMTILAHKDDITADCKSLPTDWDNGDWQSAGADVGDIVGILIGGLESNRLNEL